MSEVYLATFALGMSEVYLMTLLSVDVRIVSCDLFLCVRKSYYYLVLIRYLYLILIGIVKELLFILTLDSCRLLS